MNRCLNVRNCGMIVELVLVLSEAVLVIGKRRDKPV
jgi:hypothetical protein